jgi:glycosyltransferase involved in cell wall biosynthesis
VRGADRARLAAAILRDEYVLPLPRASATGSERASPLVTVLIATYNRSEVLRYALASAVGQSYARLEILVVGDACTDDSEQVVAQAGDSRVRWINLERNSGSQAGPNQAGLEQAQGELIAYLGHDDLWRRDHIALLVANLQARRADATSTVASFVYPRPLPRRAFASPPPGEFVPPSSLMHTAAAARRAGGWIDHRETIRPPDDDFIWRLRESGASFSRVRALTVVKFASSQRAGSYRDGRAGEQAAFSRRLEGRSFVAREVATWIALQPFRRIVSLPAVDPAAAARPGGVVSEYRRIRGLD